jgi:hypothetical protein
MKDYYQTEPIIVEDWKKPLPEKLLIKEFPFSADAEEPQCINLSLISQLQDIFCGGCMRIVRAKLFHMVYLDEFKNPIAYGYPVGIGQHEHFRCKECQLIDFGVDTKKLEAQILNITVNTARNCGVKKNKEK